MLGPLPGGVTMGARGMRFGILPEALHPWCLPPCLSFPVQQEASFSGHVALSVEKKINLLLLFHCFFGLVSALLSKKN